MYSGYIQTYISQSPYTEFMYRMYVDESGVDSINDPQSDWFTTGGLIIHRNDIQLFERAHDGIMARFFPDAPDRTFKLHYSRLLCGRGPYERMSPEERLQLADSMFSTIVNMPCYFVSASINKNRHYQKYQRPVKAQAYTLLLCMERFELFLQDHNDEGDMVYERYTRQQRRDLNYTRQNLSRYGVLSPSDQKRIREPIISGDPLEHRALQFADFAVYAPQKRLTTRGHKGRRWSQIRPKYYNADAEEYRCRGEVIV